MHRKSSAAAAAAADGEDGPALTLVRRGPQQQHEAGQEHERLRELLGPGKLHLARHLQRLITWEELSAEAGRME